MKLLEFYSNLKDKIEDDDIVKENFQVIFAKFKKSASANKEAIEELEKKFFAGEKLNIQKGKNQGQNQPGLASAQKNIGGNKNRKRGVKRTYSKMKNNDYDSDSVDNDLGESENSNVKNRNAANNIQRVSTRNMRSATKNNQKRNTVNDEESDYDEDFEGDSDY